MESSTKEQPAALVSKMVLTERLLDVGKDAANLLRTVVGCTVPTTEELLAASRHHQPKELTMEALSVVTVQRLLGEELATVPERQLARLSVLETVQQRPPSLLRTRR